MSASDYNYSLDANALYSTVNVSNFLFFHLIVWRINCYWRLVRFCCLRPFLHFVAKKIRYTACSLMIIILGYQVAALQGETSTWFMAPFCLNQSTITSQLHEPKKKKKLNIIILLLNYAHWINHSILQIKKYHKVV